MAIFLEARKDSCATQKEFQNLRLQTATKLQQNTAMVALSDIVPAGVVTGDNLLKLLEHARENGYAIPAVNCTRCVLLFCVLC